MADTNEERRTVSPKVIWLSIMAGLGTLLFGAFIALFIEALQYRTYYDKFYKIEIKYPLKWKVVADTSDAIVAFIAPKDDSLDFFRENLNIAVTDNLDEGMTLEKFSKQMTVQAETALGMNVEILKSEPVILDGRRAYFYEIQSKGEPEMRIKSYWYIKDNKAFIITWATDMIHYKQYVKIFNHMVKSLSTHDVNE